MNTKSILLAINGSEESLHAAELAWSLARSLSATIQAQTVVETKALWQLIDQGRPGLIGSGPYIAAYEAARLALKSAAEVLRASYEARIGPAKISSEFFIDEGNTVNEICRRAESSDLVIVGRRRSSTESADVEREENAEHTDPFCLPRYSISERLIYSCPRPLLVVQDRTQLWKSIRFIVSDASYDPESLRSFLQLTEWLSVPREILCVADKKKLEEMLSQVKLEAASSKGITVQGQECNLLESAWLNSVDVAAGTLAVIYVSSDGEGRKHCLGIEPVTLARALKSSATLFLAGKMQAQAVAPQTARQIRDVSYTK